MNFQTIVKLLILGLLFHLSVGWGEAIRNSIKWERLMVDLFGASGNLLHNLAHIITPLLTILLFFLILKRIEFKKREEQDV